MVQEYNAVFDRKMLPVQNVENCTGSKYLQECAMAWWRHIGTSYRTQAGWERYLPQHLWAEYPMEREQPRLKKLVLWGSRCVDTHCPKRTFS